MLFSTIPGLKEEKKQLIHAINNNRIAHAQLFSGNPGSANLALALAYITYLNCEDKKESDACGECASCSKTNKMVHPDIHFIYPIATNKKVTKDPLSSKFITEWRPFIIENPYRTLEEWANYSDIENKQCSISVEESRTIKASLSLKSFEGSYKCVIIWLPELMKAPAANSLLKILEEPADKTIFMLVSNNREANITTILSRAQVFHVRPFNEKEITQFLISKGKEEKRAQQIAHMSEGNMCEALQLSNDIEDDNHNLFQNWMRNCFKNNFGELINEADIFQKMNKESQKGLLQYGLNVIRENLLYINKANDQARFEGDEKTFVENFSKMINNSKVEKITQIINDTYYYIERNANPKISFLNASIQIAKTLKS